MSSLGFRGGQGGDSRGGGGYGGESFLHLVTGNNGKGGDISGASWTVNTNGLGGGGAGDSQGQFCLIVLVALKMVGNLKVTFIFYIQAAKEVPVDIMPEGEGLILLIILMTAPVEGEGVVIFLVVGVVVLAVVVVTMEEKEEQHLLL